jgi:hypothetical protein
MRSRFPIALISATSMVAALLVWFVGSALPVSAPKRATYTVLFVEETRYGEAHGLERMRNIARRVDPWLPGETIRWRFLSTDPDGDAGFRARVNDLEPDLVIVANENLLTGLKVGFEPLNILLPTELSPAEIRNQFADVRAVHRVAFVSWYAPVAAKLLDHLVAIASPPLTRIAVLVEPDMRGAAGIEAFLRAATQRGILGVLATYRDYPDFRAVFADVVEREAPGAFYLPITASLLEHIDSVALDVSSARRPIAYSRGDQVEHGGLFAIDPDPDEAYDQLARYVVLILHGADPNELEILEPSRFDTTINLSAARESGQVFPYEMLVEAAHIIE